MTKIALSRAAHRFSYASGFSTLRARGVDAMRVIAVHEVGGDDSPTRVFRDQMTYLKRNFHVVPLERIVNRARGGDGVPRGEIAITFDDGLRNQFTEACPILREFELPATFFVCPELIEDNRWLWNNEVRERLRSLPASNASALLREFGSTASTIGCAVEWMKTLDTATRGSVEAGIAERTRSFVPNARQRRLYDPMSWNELSALSSDLMTIGSHSLSHAMLPTCTDGELEREVRESKAWIEERLGRPVDLFCYPNGDYDVRTVSAVRLHYAAAVSTALGVVRAGDDPHLLKRIPIARHLPGLAWSLWRHAI